MKVEILQPKDLMSYKKLIDECFGSSNDLAQYEKYCTNETYTIYIIKDENEIIGSATQYIIDLFTFSFQPSIMIFNVAVKPNYRRKKIAQKLLKHIIEDAKKQGYHSLTLTCLDDAYPAHKLYESIGLKKTNSIKYEMNLS